MGSKLCDLCGKRSARYVCQECGRNVCELCLNTYTWLCSECYKQFEQARPVEKEDIFPFDSLFTKIFIIGFILIFVGMIILVVAALISGQFDSLEFFMYIWPIPIIFGAGKYPFWAILIGVILTILGLVIFFVLRRTEGWRVSTSRNAAATTFYDGP